MAKILKCTFKRVNGDKTGVFTRVAMTKNSASPGILYMVNCPDGKTFKCDATDGGQNSYWRLIDPQDYKINSSGKVYVWLDSSFCSWTEIDDAPPAPAPQPAPPTNPPQVYTIKPTDFDPSSIGFAFGSGSGKNVLFPKTAKEGDTLYEKDNIKYISLTKINRTNFFNDYSSFRSDLNIIEKNLDIGIRQENVDSIRNDLVNKFNRFKKAFPDIQLSKSFAHVFFTRPDLNLYSDIKNNVLVASSINRIPEYIYLNKNNPDLLKSLTKDFSQKHDFNPFLSNMASSFELKDEVLSSAEYGQTFTGHRIKYGRHTIDSKVADSFSIQYTDDEDLRVYKIHKAWVDYISRVYRGEISPKRYYIEDRILDYACSVYYILCGPDGETILFWSKYTGVFPTNIPSAMASFQSNSVVKIPEYTIQYDYAWKEDFNPYNLAEFNINSKVNPGVQRRYIKTYENELTTTGRTFVGQPFIESSMGADGYNFRLRFMAP